MTISATRAAFSALLLVICAALRAQTAPTTATAPDTSPAPAPATTTAVAPVFSATLAGGKITFIYKDTVISTGSAGKVTAVKQISPTRIDLTFSNSGNLPDFRLPAQPTNIFPSAPIVTATERGPTVATYAGKNFSFTAASADEDVVVTQSHAAVGAEHPEYRGVSITNQRKEPRQLTLSLCVDDEDLTPFYTAYAAVHPMKLNWPDRRPIIHLANDDAQARNFTLRNWAIQGIQLCKSINAQLALYHGLEGMDDASGLKYMGCPELIDEIRTDKLAGLVELFKKANVNFGFCIRPWVFNRIGGKWVEDKTVSPQAALERHLDFVSKIGGTAVYIDSCDTRSAQWLADLHAKYPNILLIPEQPNAGIRNSAQLAYGAPLRECSNGSFSPLIQLYPDAFQILLHADGLTEKQWQIVIHSNGKYVPFVQPYEVATLQRLRKLAHAAATTTATQPATAPATNP